MDDYKWVLIDEARELLHYTQVESLDKIEEIIKVNKMDLNLLKGKMVNYMTDAKVNVKLEIETAIEKPY
jgi:hypothetical protein